MYTNLQQEISKISLEDVQVFRGYLGAYMECVNECVSVDMACKVINGYVSDDAGLYFTLWLIAQGEKRLLNALIKPNSLLKLTDILFGNAYFEMLTAIGMDGDYAFEAMAKIQQECVSKKRRIWI